MELTALDRAHAAMEAAPDSDAARLRFYERLADGELFLLLKEEPQGDHIAPEVFETSDGPFVLVFDRELRLSAFSSRIAAFAALSGRSIVGMLAGQGIGLALNPDVAPSAFLVGPEAVDWLNATLEQRPDIVQARPEALTPPHALPEALLGALDTKLALAAGMARAAFLVGARHADGTLGNMLAFLDATPGAEDALARAVGETLSFSGIEAGVLDVAFFSSVDPVAARLERVGLRIDLPEAEAVGRPAAPGMDPDRPPRLR